MRYLKLIAALVFVSFSALSQETKIDTATKVPEATKPAEAKSEWYQKINLRGYAQVRYNRLLETNQDLQCEQCDKSWGKNGGFFLRRLRLVFSGQISNRLYFYIQPDFASSPDGSNNNFGQIRDAYFDLGLDTENEFRLRFGQSKVPYGFENMQSSQNRLPLDRNDGLNSAISNERDLGVFFYWAPKKIRERFAYLVSSGLKGSGDYGVFALGAYNGQTANKNEANNQPHIVSRFSYPIQIGKQIIEPGIQAYHGKYVVSSISTGVQAKPQNQYRDQRAAASFVLYPQPFGLQAEYNIGTGPEYNVATNTIEQTSLRGGYALASYALKFNKQLFFPFVRYHFYDGGKKFERDARTYKVKELEIGTEWQPFKNFELVTMYTISKRRFEDAARPFNDQQGNLLRIQFQFNY
ncbi:porin [Paradesertivirga mongoliensis]|uniref:Porin n=1 Tax=Paradesertivirga mongoliensis TaxID=2100740 RepID=A0ABW4ZPL9_9SPHI|nr:porin [Pedobacter mongoliensis]